jgi:hypothetical protein
MNNDYGALNKRNGVTKINVVYVSNPPPLPASTVPDHIVLVTYTASTFTPSTVHRGGPSLLARAAHKGRGLTGWPWSRVS